MISRLMVAAGLVALSISQSDAALQVELTPNASPPTRIFIAQPEVQFDRAFFQDMRNTRGSLGDMRPADRERLADDLGAGLREALAQALRERGFEVVASPAADALSLTPTLTNLYVNTPHDALASRVYARSAGTARMVVEGRDASGSRVLRATSAGEAGETAAFHELAAADTRRAFGDLFREWARELATALPKAR